MSIEFRGISINLENISVNHKKLYDPLILLDTKVLKKYTWDKKFF